MRSSHCLTALLSQSAMRFVDSKEDFADRVGLDSV